MTTMTPQPIYGTALPDRIEGSDGKDIIHGNGAEAPAQGAVRVAVDIAGSPIPWHSAVGVYEIGADGSFNAIRLLLPPETNRHVATSTVWFDAPAGARLGFFVLPNALGSSGNAVLHEQTGRFEFRTKEGSVAGLESVGRLTLWHVADDGGETAVRTAGGRGSIHAAAEAANGFAPNPHGRDMARGSLNPDGSLRIGFNEFLGNPDTFNQMVLTIRPDGPVTIAEPELEAALMAAAPHDHDTLSGGGGDDRLYGGTGNDVLSGGEGDDRLIGGTGDDALNGGDGCDWLDGGIGNDMLTGGTAADTLQGDKGDDTLDGGSGDDLLDGGSGNDSLLGGSGADTLLGSGGDDHLDGGKSDDRLDGGSGNDTLLGDDGHDSLNGGSGDDLLHGGKGGDTIRGGSGHDAIFGETGDDLISGGTGADTIDAGDGADRVKGDSGNDLISGGEGADTLLGGTGDDTLSGGGEFDHLFGGRGADLLAGDAGNDWLDGSHGDDILDGGTGSDTLIGGEGSDWLTGGQGADTFVWRTQDVRAWTDTITDFAARYDRIDLTGLGLLGRGWTAETFRDTAMTHAAADRVDLSIDDLVISVNVASAPGTDLVLDVWNSILFA